MNGFRAMRGYSWRECEVANNLFWLFLGRNGVRPGSRAAEAEQAALAVPLSVRVAADLLFAVQQLHA